METTTAQRTGPLAGYRVLDLTAVVLGPLATQILGDYGADVIKIEPLTGDQMRANGVSKHRGMSSIFLAINRNKRSLALDLKSKEGIDVIHRLLPTVDVLGFAGRVWMKIEPGAVTSSFQKSAKVSAEVMAPAPTEPASRRVGLVAVLGSTSAPAVGSVTSTRSSAAA
jgi:hypothetical protein